MLPSGKKFGTISLAVFLGIIFIFVGFVFYFNVLSPSNSTDFGALAEGLHRVGIVFSIIFPISILGLIISIIALIKKENRFRAIAAFILNGLIFFPILYFILRYASW